MPIKKSAKKYIGVSSRKTLKNKNIKGVYRNAMKKTREDISEKNIKKATEHFKKAAKALDKAAQKKVLKKNTVARYKSRLNKSLKDISKK